MDQHLNTSCFTKMQVAIFFCGYKILTDGVFVTDMSSSAGISF